MSPLRFSVAVSLFAALALPALVHPQPARAAGDPIAVEQCFVTEPTVGDLSKKAGGTQIVYVNPGPKTAVSITFRVAYRNALSTYNRRVTDVGTFAPGVKIDHHFALFDDITYAGKHVLGCHPVAVKWSDGTYWRGD